MEAIAAVLAQYGPWGITAILMVASVRLYYDVRGLNQSRIDDVKHVLESYHDDTVETVKAWQSATSMLDSIREEIRRRGSK